jgi:acyl-[acyl-carrier-protein]-phospholipid O-acyltransferase/long-chain-fatty-acid--[acyl-carrier-protein] ligase
MRVWRRFEALMVELGRWLMRNLLRLVYRVRVVGLENYAKAGKRVLVVANHTSFLDAVLLAVFLPDRLTFAINTGISKRWWIRPLLVVVDAFPLDPTNPYSIKSLIRYISQDKRAAIFPEGRITVTGSLMKIYPGPGLVADKSGAMLLPVRIDGAQYTPFSRLRGRIRMRLFPQITLTILPPRRFDIPPEIRGRERRREAGKQLADLMTEMVFATSNYRRTLFEALLDARRVTGGSHVIAEDIERKPITFNDLIVRSTILGGVIARATRRGEMVGLMLPNAIPAIVSFFGLLARGRVPAMLNYTLGSQSLVASCKSAQIRRVYTSERFVQAAKLEKIVDRLRQTVEVVFLEELRDQVTPAMKLGALLARPFAGWRYRRERVSPDEPAVVLFTSGSEGTPKGVVLSHANVLANREQVMARFDFGSHDIILNALPMFHSFGLTAGTLLPILSGMRTFFYPSPLHYRIVPEMAYDVNATVMFGTNTFLAGYARFAHPYDFYSVRYAFAGAEKLKDETRRTCTDKFGVQIFEGYGATETSPVLAANTPVDTRVGTVGRFLPGIEHGLDPVPGVEGGRLSVRGPNVMLGYLRHDEPGVIQPPSTERGPGWYDTGDIVSLDADGFVTIRGRAKRFAKIGGEMVSLAAAEEIAARTWPESQHAVVSVPDAQKGEQLILVTTKADAARQELSARARSDGVSELSVPKRIVHVEKIPLLGSGKADYPAVSALVQDALPRGERGAT